MNIDESACTRCKKSLQTLLGAFVYSTRQFEQAITLAACCEDDWVTNVSFEEVEGCLNTYLAGNFDTVKAALRPNGEG